MDQSEFPVAGATGASECVGYRRPYSPYIFAQLPFSPWLACMTKAGSLTNSEGTASSLPLDCSKHRRMYSSCYLWLKCSPCSEFF